MAEQLNNHFLFSNVYGLFIKYVFALTIDFFSIDDTLRIHEICTFPKLLYSRLDIFLVFALMTGTCHSVQGLYFYPVLCQHPSK